MRTIFRAACLQPVDCRRLATAPAPFEALPGFTTRGPEGGGRAGSHASRAAGESRVLSSGHERASAGKLTAFSQSNAALTEATDPKPQEASLLPTLVLESPERRARTAVHFLKDGPSSTHFS